MNHLSAPCPANHFLTDHVQLLLRSYRQLLGRDLIDPALSATAAAETIFYAPFVVVSHDAAANPIFNYGNQTALTLFELTWDEFVTLPSRRSAEPINRQERAQLLAAVTQQGFIENYSGVRIAKTGRRFRIESVTVWNLLDLQGQYQGQAATYPHWQYL
jgi:hypothetical protein